MRFSLDLPEIDHTVAYGFDPALGWFGQVLDPYDHEVDSYDALDADYDHVRPLRGLLRWFAKQSDRFDEADLIETLERLLHQDFDQLPPHLLLLGEVISNLQLAGRS